MFGKNDLAEEEQIKKFLKGKTTRQIAVMGIVYWNNHTKECAARWRTIQHILIAILIGVCVELLPNVGKLLFSVREHNIIPTTWLI